MVHLYFHNGSDEEMEMNSMLKDPLPVTESGISCRPWSLELCGPVPLR